MKVYLIYFYEYGDLNIYKIVDSIEKAKEIINNPPYKDCDFGFEEREVE